MELVYSAVWGNEKPIKRNNHGKVVVTWSCRNLVAFTTGFRKTPTHHDGRSNPAKTDQKPQLSNGIHIMDPDCPWEVCSIASGHEDPVDQLVWDGTGSRLLSIDTVGLCKIWAMREHMINDWECILTADVGEGEKLVTVSWIDTGTKFLFSPGDDTQTTVPKFEDRFAKMMARPPYEEFPYRARDGLVAVSESGQVCRVVLKPSLEIKKVCLATTRSRVAVADLAFTNTGKVIVTANEGYKRTPVQFYRVSLMPATAANSRGISSTSLPSLFPHHRSELQDFREYSVTNIQFISKFAGESVLVFTKGISGSCVKLWKMEKVPITLHEKFQGVNSTRVPRRDLHQNDVGTFKWLCLAQYYDLVEVTQLAMPRLPCRTHMFNLLPSPAMAESSQISYPAFSILLVHKDNKITLLHLTSLAHQGSFYTTSKDSDQVAKTTQFAAGVTEDSGDSVGAICYSPCCCCVAAVTRAGDLKLYKFQHQADASLAHRLKRPLVDLLEFCLLTGWEWWDVLMAIHHGTPLDTVEVVLRQFCEEFQCESLQHRRLLLARFRAMQASLFRCMKDGAGKAVDCYTRQLLVAITTSFKNLLPSPNSVDQLSKMHSVSDDVDKIVQAVDSNDFAVDSGALLSMQPLIQWITDLAMLVVVVFTRQQGKDTLPGATLIRDTASLSLIRDMLVLVRLWGQSTPGVLPCVTPTADKSESLVLLFKILTKIWLQSKQNTEEPEHEERLAVEAAPLLPSQLFLSNMQTPSLNRGVSGRPGLGHVKPSVYQFGQKPAVQSGSGFQHPFATAILPVPPDGSHHLDVTRRIYLDTCSNGTLKQCTRCNCLSLMSSVSDQLAAMKWDKEWAKSCVCGGSWRRYTPHQEPTTVGR